MAMTFFSKSWSPASISLLITSCLAASSAIGADVPPEQQYKAYLTKAQTLFPVSEFGDQISLRDGSLAFKNVDIEVPGVGPTIRLVRTARIEDGAWNFPSTTNAIGEWEFELPRIKTVTADPSPFLRGQPLEPSSPIGWQTGGSNKDARCSTFGPPPDVTYETSTIEFPSTKWWFGYQLVDSEGNEQTLFHRSTAVVNQSYKIGTSSNWIVGCLPQTANGAPGEGFLAIAPDGTKYRFDYLAYYGYDGLSLEFEHMPPKDYTLVYTLPRRYAAMLVTQIEDRFGNTVIYNYSDGKLTGIDASDGRRIRIVRGSGSLEVVVGSPTVNRTWTYVLDAENSAHLSRVDLPDGSFWGYAGPFHRSLNSTYEFAGCSQQYVGEPSPDTRQLSVHAPSGATATFTVSRRLFGRSYVPKYCSGPTSQMNPDAGYALVPMLWIGRAITSKVVTGPGLSPMRWAYSYSEHNGSWSMDCTAGCPSTVWTDVVEPDGVRTRSYFSNKWDQTENKSVLTEIFNEEGRKVQWSTTTYATANPQATNPYPWPLRIGTFSGWNVNEEVNLRWTPASEVAVHQDGMVFRRRTTRWDEWARPTTIVRESTPEQAP
jgi:hypothetical protein